MGFPFSHPQDRRSDLTPQLGSSSLETPISGLAEGVSNPSKPGVGLTCHRAPCYRGTPFHSLLSTTSMAPRHGFTIWLTGLHCSGKSTLAGLLQQAVSKAGCAVEILDGDEVRQRLSPTLGFSKAEREEQLRRIAYVAQLLTRVGAVAMSRLFLPTVPRAIMPRTHSGALWRCTWSPSSPPPPLVHPRSPLPSSPGPHRPAQHPKRSSPIPHCPQPIHNT